MPRRRSNRQRMRARQRVYPHSIARRSLLPVTLPRLDLRLLEDRRRYDPTRRVSLPRRELARGAISSRVVERGRMPATLRMSFVAPKRVLVCVRRSQRREVLFAERRTGKGSRSPRHRNEWSDVKC